MRINPKAKLDPSQVNWGPGGYPARARYRSKVRRRRALQARRDAFFTARNQALGIIWSWGYPRRKRR